mgnify:CR=1 FL=1
MKREVVRPWPVAPERDAPFVPVIRIAFPGASLPFISGMGPLPLVHRHPHVAEKWVRPENAGEQARALDKIRKTVETADGKFQHIVKMTRHLQDMRD